MFPKLSKSIYIDSVGTNECTISKCKDATRQVLYENQHLHVWMPLNCASCTTGFHIMWCIFVCKVSYMYVYMGIFTVFIDKT